MHFSFLRMCQNCTKQSFYGTFFHHMCRKWPKICKKIKQQKLNHLKWNFDLGGLLNDQGKKVYFNKVSWGRTPRPPPPVRGCTLIYPPLTTSWHFADGGLRPLLFSDPLLLWKLRTTLQQSSSYLSLSVFSCLKRTTGCLKSIKHPIWKQILKLLCQLSP